MRNWRIPGREHAACVRRIRPGKAPELVKWNRPRGNSGRYICRAKLGHGTARRFDPRAEAVDERTAAFRCRRIAFARVCMCGTRRTACTCLREWIDRTERVEGSRSGRKYTFTIARCAVLGPGSVSRQGRSISSRNHRQVWPDCRKQNHERCQSCSNIERSWGRSIDERPWIEDWGGT